MGQAFSGMPSAGVNVYLLAENRLVRETLARMLQRRGGLSLVGMSRYTESARAEILTSNCSILLMDSFPTARDTDLLTELIERSLQTRVVLFGMDEDPDLFLKSVCFGVSGYMLKDASASEIIAAVQAVAQGEAVCPPKLCMVLIQHLSREFRMKPRINGGQGSHKGCLTHRQLQLVDLVAKGLSNKEIATNLNLSEFTVKNHIRRIMKQVHATDRHEAVATIRSNGFLPGA